MKVLCYTTREQPSAVCYLDLSTCDLWKMVGGKFLVKETWGWHFKFSTVAVLQCVYGTRMALDH